MENNFIMDRHLFLREDYVLYDSIFGDAIPIHPIAMYSPFCYKIQISHTMNHVYETYPVANKTLFDI